MVTFIATSFALISSLSSLLYNNKASYYDIWYVKMYIVNIVDRWIIVFSQNTSSVAVATILLLQLTCYYSVYVLTCGRIKSLLNFKQNKKQMFEMHIRSHSHTSSIYCIQYYSLNVCFENNVEPQTVHFCRMSIVDCISCHILHICSWT